MNQPRRQDGDD